MTYCTQCGSGLPEEARFCPSCGAAVQARPEQTPSVHASSASVAPAPAGGTASHPFAGIPLSDYVRDALAFASLVLSLFLPWRLVQGTTIFAAERLDVVLITLLSIVSLTIPYLWRTGVFGPSWSFVATQRLRLAANAPYAILVLVFLVITALQPSALGPALAFGLGGAVLAAQPRRSELADGDDARDRHWVLVLLGIAALVVALTLVQIIEGLTRSLLTSRLSEVNTGLFVSSTLLGIVGAAFVALLALLIARGSDSARRLAIGLGVAGVFLALLALSPQVLIAGASFSLGWPNLLVAFWIVFGAAASAPSVARRCTRLSWRDTVVAANHVAWATSALVGLLAIVALFTILLPGAGYGTNPIPWVIALIFGVFGVAGGLVSRSLLTHDTRQGFLVISGYAILLFVLGLVLLILWAALPLGVLAPLTLVLAFALPVGLAAAAWGPAEARRHYARLPPLAESGGYSFPGNASAGTAQATATAPDVSPDPFPVAGAAGAAEPDPQPEPLPATEPAPQNEPTAQAEATAQAEPPGQVEPPEQAEPAEGTGSVAAEAADPDTPLERLHEIAASCPSARAAVAANPSTYPDLLDWLGRLGDPAVNAALTARERHTSP